MNRESGERLGEAEAMSSSGDSLCAAPLHVLTPAPATSHSFYRCCGKRLFDVVLAGTAGLCLLPVIGITWLFVRFKLGSPAIFQQPRAGLHGGVFTLFKFRSMKEAVDQHGHPLPDEQRLTSFGQKLRSLSLDELPQLWNIVRGDMSLIGPRPLLVRYLPRYSPEQARRHEVRPGITGWAQVNGRNSIEWDEKFKLDVWYVDHCSLMLDLRILFATFASVFLRRGISSDSHVTMPEFMGTAKNAAAEHTAVDANGHTH